MKRGDYKTQTQAKKYHQERFKNGLETVNLDEIEILKDWLTRIQADKKVSLDIGSGTGRILRPLLDSGSKKIYALDQSTAMLTYLKDIYPNEIKTGKILPLIAHSHKIPLTPNSIDVATAFHLFKHLPNVEPTVMEVNKILKPGGYFIFDVLNINSIIRFNLGTCYALSENQISSILSKNGFTIKATAYVHPLGETIYGKLGTLLNMLAKIFDTSDLKIGTKIFILANKNG